MFKTFFCVLIIFSFLFPEASFSSNIGLDPCIQVSHCVIEEWDVNDIEEPFSVITEIIKNLPRTKIVDIEGNYLHAEVTSKWMKYVDDLEVSYLPEQNNLKIRSESRVGDSDLGVNLKRVNSIREKFL